MPHQHQTRLIVRVTAQLTTVTDSRYLVSAWKEGVPLMAKLPACATNEAEDGRLRFLLLLSLSK
jgi:hypothetical protein